MVDTVIETPVVATPVVVEAPAMVEMVVAPVVEELYDEYCSPLPSPSDGSAMFDDSDEEPLVPAWSAAACRPALAAQPSAPDAQASAPDAQASAPEAQASASEAQASASEAQAMAPIAQALAPGASASASPSAEVLLQRAIDEQRIMDENGWVDCDICKNPAKKGTCRILAEGNSVRDARLECKKCQRVSLALYRKFGSVNPLFREMGDGMQKELYHKCHPLKPRHMEAHAKKVITASNSTTHSYAEGGRFLPVSVWRTQGFEIDESRIMDEDRDHSDVFGHSVRLRIRSRETRGEVSVAETVSLRSRRRLTRANSTSLPIEDQPTSMALQDQQEEADEAGEKKSSSSSSNSSSSSCDSSSSSSSGKKKKQEGKQEECGPEEA